MRKANITFLISSLRGGGAERTCVTLANALIERGWDVDLVVLNLAGAILQKELNTSVELIDLQVDHARSAFFGLLRYLYRKRPGKILVFNHQLAIALVFLRMLFRFDVKILLRNISTLSRKRESEKSFWHKYIVDGVTRLFYRKVDRVIAQSRGMREDLIKNYSVSPSDIVVIYNPINPGIESYLAGSERLNNENKNYLLYVGRLEPVKAVHLLIEAFAEVQQRFPLLRLKIVGQGSLDKYLKGLVHERAVADKVDFEGFRQDTIPYYLGAKATVLTSHYEGFPNVLVESIALGTPVVSFDCQSGPSEIVRDGLNGYLVESGNVEMLVDRLIGVIEAEFQPARVMTTAVRFGSNLIVQRYIGELSK